MAYRPLGKFQEEDSGAEDPSRDESASERRWDFD